MEHQAQMGEQVDGQVVRRPHQQWGRGGGGLAELKLQAQSGSPWSSTHTHTRYQMGHAMAGLNIHHFIGAFVLCV